MEIEKVEYRGWPNCWRLSNRVVDLIATTDVGPRIMRFGFLGEENEFKEYREMVGKTGGSEWRIYGGHRLWHAPEASPRSYSPDNGPVQFQQHPSFVRLIQATEPTTGIQKEIDIRLAQDKAAVHITHRLRNSNLWDVRLAPWALSVMAPGGRAILPFPPRGSHQENLLPANSLTLWAYTDLSDPRWTWGNRFLMLRQDPSSSSPQKVGMMNTEGWVAYARNGHLFVKKFQYTRGAEYPDLGCSAETFTNADMLEAETLGPLVSLPPGEAVEHVEGWSLHRGVPVPDNDTDVDRHVLPKIGRE